jgi:hypothetical protein
LPRLPTYLTLPATFFPKTSPPTRLQAYADSERWSIALAAQDIIEGFLDKRDAAPATPEPVETALQPASVLPSSPPVPRPPRKRLIFGAPKIADLVYSAIELSREKTRSALLQFNRITSFAADRKSAPLR